MPFTLLDRYFWLICIVVTGINYLFAARVPPELATATDAQRSRRAVLIQRGFGFSALPWLVMGLGVMTGKVEGVFSYLDPNAGNPYVWAWYASVFFLSCAFSYWVLARDGAREIVELKLLRAHGPMSEIALRVGWVKLFAAFAPLFVLLWIWMASAMDVPK